MRFGNREDFLAVWDWLRDRGYELRSDYQTRYFSRGDYPWQLVIKVAPGGRF